MCSTTSPAGEGVYKVGLALLGLFVLKTDLEVGVTIYRECRPAGRSSFMARFFLTLR
jgi:hypothetical protein